MIGKQNIKLLSFISVFALLLSLFSPFATASAEEVKSVAEAIADNNGVATVEGYIVGVTKSTSSYSHSSPFTIATNIAIADSPTETDPGKILPVQLPSGYVRSGLNLVDNPGNLGRKVQITGSLEAYFTVPGLKNSSAYSWVEETDPTQVSAVTASLNQVQLSREQVLLYRQKRKEP